MAKIFRWTLTKSGFLKQTLNLYLDGVLFGTIPDYSFQEPAEMNGRKYIIEDDNAFLDYPKIYKLVDLETKKATCEIIWRYSDQQVFVHCPNKVRYELPFGIGSPAFKDGHEVGNGNVVQSYNNGTMWSPKSGKLEVRADKNTEALIMGFYFAVHLYNVYRSR